MRPKALSTVMLAVLLSACVSYESDSQHVDGQITNPDRLAQIQAGTTSTAWLLENFGAPDAIDRINDDESVWRYAHTSREARKFQALVLLAYESRREDRTLYHFAVVGDVVQRYWVEHP